MQQQIFQIGVGVERFLDAIEELGANDTATAPQQCAFAVIQRPIMLLRGGLQLDEALCVTADLRCIQSLAHGSDREGIDALKAAVPMPYLVHTVLGHPGQGKIRCLDPEKHRNGDRHPSCVVNDASLRCFVCGLHLDVIGLLQKERGLTFGQALDELRRLAPGARTAVANLPAPVLQRDGTDFAELYDALFA